MEGKVIHFNFGDGENNFFESVTYPVENFRGFACIDATSLGMYFKPLLTTSKPSNNDLIDITIISGKHREVIRDIWENIYDPTLNFITVFNGDTTTSSDPELKSTFVNKISKYIITCNSNNNGQYISTVNITGTGEAELFTGWSQFDSITLASVHASNAATVDLYLDLTADGSNDYILKGTTIPLGATLRLDSEDLNFDLNRYSLFIKLGAGSIDAIARKYHHPEFYLD